MSDLLQGANTECNFCLHQNAWFCRFFDEIASLAPTSVSQNSVSHSVILSQTPNNFVDDFPNFTWLGSGFCWECKSKSIGQWSVSSWIFLVTHNLGTKSSKSLTSGIFFQHLRYGHTSFISWHQPLILTLILHDPEMEKAWKIARMNILTKRNSTKTCMSRHIAIRAKTA